MATSTVEPRVIEDLASFHRRRMIKRSSLELIGESSSARVSTKKNWHSALMRCPQCYGTAFVNHEMRYHRDGATFSSKNCRWKGRFLILIGRDSRFVNIHAWACLWKRILSTGDTTFKLPARMESLYRNTVCSLCLIKKGSKYRY